MSRILALDLSTVTGWCVQRGDSYTTGEWHLTGERGQKANQLRGLLIDAIGEHDPDLVAYEHPMTNRGRNGTLLGGLVLMTEAVCEELWTPYAFVWTTTLKKYATGSGRAKKPEMIEAAMPWVGDVSEHEADAFHVARWADENVEIESA